MDHPQSSGRKAKQEHTCPICYRKFMSETLTKQKNKTRLTSGSDVHRIPSNLQPKFTRSLQFRSPCSTPIRLQSSTTTSYSPLDPLQLLSRGQSAVSDNINALKISLSNVVKQSKVFLERGVQSLDITQFFKACEDVQARVNDKTESDKEFEECPKCTLDRLTTQIKKAISIIKHHEQDSFMTTSVDDFVKACQLCEEKLNKCFVGPYSSTMVSSMSEAKSRLLELKRHIEDVNKLTSTYINKGIYKPGIDKSTSFCETNSCAWSKCNKDNENSKKIERLKRNANLEKLAPASSKRNMTSLELDKIKENYEKFSLKLDEYKGIKPTVEDVMNRLASQIDETLKLTKSARKSNLITESLENLIKSCKSKKYSKCDVCPSRAPPILDEIRHNLDEMLKTIITCQDEGVIEQEFTDKVLEAKSKIDDICANSFNKCDDECIRIYPTDSDTCSCRRNLYTDDFGEACESQLVTIQEIPPHDFSSTTGPTCGACGTEQEDTEQNDTKQKDIVLKQVMPQKPSIIIIAEPDTTSVAPEQTDEAICHICKTHLAEGVEDCPEKVEEPKPESPPPSPPPSPTPSPPPPPTTSPPPPKLESRTLMASAATDSMLGYFENKVRTITRVTRSLNPDGTIREEKEVVTIRTEKHDPLATNIDDDEGEKFMQNICYDKKSTVEVSGETSGDVSEGISGEASGLALGESFGQVASFIESNEACNSIVVKKPKDHIENDDNVCKPAKDPCDCLFLPKLSQTGFKRFAKIVKSDIMNLTTDNNSLRNMPYFKLWISLNDLVNDSNFSKNTPFQ